MMLLMLLMLLMGLFVLELDGEAVGEFLPEGEHGGADEVVGFQRASGVLGAALMGAHGSPFLIGPVISEESLELGMVLLRTREGLTPLEEAAEELAERLVAVRKGRSQADELPAAVRVADAEQVEVAFQTRQERAVVGVEAEFWGQRVVALPVAHGPPPPCRRRRRRRRCCCCPQWRRQRRQQEADWNPNHQHCINQ